MSVSHPLSIGPTVIGPVPWRYSTMSGIKDNNKVINRSDETVKFGRSVDPLPHIRFVYHKPDTGIIIQLCLPACTEFLSVWHCFVSQLPDKPIQVRDESVMQVITSCCMHDMPDRPHNCYILANNVDYV